MGSCIRSKIHCACGMLWLSPLSSYTRLMSRIGCPVVRSRRRCRLGGGPRRLGAATAFSASAKGGLLLGVALKHDVNALLMQPASGGREDTESVQTRRRAHSAAKRTRPTGPSARGGRWPPPPLPEWRPKCPLSAARYCVLRRVISVPAASADSTSTNVPNDQARRVVPGS